ncbi:hypothetical protein CAPTEDRAFT_182788 [Capitella teleta]|uniref:TraB domain-containing protein n=1 Tax=Capitella teleta TaxID=283909 RepID=R7V1Z4_CAPTE|nr:hypothetical protein CAPTEDRAFT_182788 [Capitella teleta]|eukprot:ELU12512.1 hypothetical protein CAPTEDRAFT_182788 [Capitella teleta]
MNSAEDADLSPAQQETQNREAALHEAVAISGDSDSEEDREEEEEEEVQGILPFPSNYLKRNTNPELPETVTVLHTDKGSTVYLVGTAHFSTQSQDDVVKTIEATQPDIVVVELCKSRIRILSLDEETLLKEAQDMNLQKIRAAIQDGGVVQGVLHLMMLSMSAYVTKQLGMAPGGEFRTAFKEALKIRGCRFHLGDRPIKITLQRVLGSLNVWQKIKLGWNLLTSKEPISKEDVERCKKKDILEEMLKEMTGEFPALSRVLVTERDQFLAHSLEMAAQPIPDANSSTGTVPSVVVGVVGIGHQKGIVENWQNASCNIADLMTVPPPSKVLYAVRITLRISVLGLAAYGGYQIFKVIRKSFS